MCWVKKLDYIGHKRFSLDISGEFLFHFLCMRACVFFLFGFKKNCGSLKHQNRKGDVTAVLVFKQSCLCNLTIVLVFWIDP